MYLCFNESQHVLRSNRNTDCVIMEVVSDSHMGSRIAMLSFLSRMKKFWPKILKLLEYLKFLIMASTYSNMFNWRVIFFFGEISTKSLTCRVFCSVFDKFFIEIEKNDDDEKKSFTICAETYFSLIYLHILLIFSYFFFAEFSVLMFISKFLLSVLGLSWTFRILEILQLPIPCDFK
jgi:hypothetical protein